jgi:hypothetical protein
MNYETKQILNYFQQNQADFEYIKLILKVNYNHSLKKHADMILSYFESMLDDVSEPIISDIASHGLAKVDWVYVVQIMKMDLLVQ